MSSPRIYDLAFDDENEDKLSRRGISEEDALDLISQPYLVVRNKRRGRGRYKVIGKDRAGRILTIIWSRRQSRLLAASHWLAQYGR